MRVLLIYPETPDTFWSFRHALKFVGKKAYAPPLGLLTVAAMLPSDWEPRLVDLNVRKLTDRDLKWADLAFVSAMLVQRESARGAIARCRNAGVRVVAGGPLFTGEHENFPEVDHFVLNEAELTLPDFLADLQRGRPGRLYASAEFADIGRTPAPRWELADLRRYAAVSIQYSRGCPFECDFCNVTSLFGHTPRLKGTTQFIAELDALYARGWRDSVFIVDDNFIGNKRRLKQELLPALIEWRRDKKGITFFTEVSVNLADDDELIAMMVEAGFDMVFVGLETPNEAGLAESGKGQNLRRDLVADVRRLHRAGLQVLGGFIVGFDSDPPTIFQKQIDFIHRSRIVTAMIGLLQAVPGTRLYQRLQAEGRLRGQASGDNVGAATNFIPRLDPTVLHSGYRNLLRSLYAPGNYYRRLQAFLREYRLPQVRPPLTRQRALAFVRSIVRLGLLHRERLHYWKVLGWTLLRRPRLVPTMVTLAIYGHHFRRVCEKSLAEPRV